MAYNDEGGAGVGGWLALFVLAMALFTPAAMVVSTAGALYGDASVAAAYGDRWTAIQAFEWTLAALVVAGCWYIAWRLNKVQVWKTVRMTIAWLWIVALGSTFADFAGISLLTGLPIGDLLRGAGAEIVRPLAFAGLWTAYFLRSKRVANTYRHDSAEVAEVFG